MTYVESGLLTYMIVEPAKAKALALHSNQLIESNETHLEDLVDMSDNFTVGLRQKLLFPTTSIVEAVVIVVVH